MKQGVVLHVGQEAYCKIIIRDSAQGARELQNMGGFVCQEDSIKVFGPDHVQGGIVSGFKGEETDIRGHKVKYDLRFDAPVVKRFFPR